MQNCRRCISLLGLRPCLGTVKDIRRLHRSAATLLSRKKQEANVNVSALFKPVQVQANADSEDVGSELVGKLEKSELLKILNKFTQRREIKSLCSENGLDGKGFCSLAHHCVVSASLCYPFSSLFAAAGLRLVPALLH